MYEFVDRTVSDLDQASRLMVWAMRSWVRRLQDDVAANLVDLSVPPTDAQRSGQFAATQVSRNFHPNASTSSRTRCKRIPVGFGRSK